MAEEIVIVGGGITGLAASLGLHRLGVGSVVLESSDSLRTTGFNLGIWTNGWRALDALGIGHIIRAKTLKLTGFLATSLLDSDIKTADIPFRSIPNQDEVELRWVNRKLLLETMENELPRGTIRYSSKVVHIESDDGHRVKSIHLADGTVLKAKVLIGCDGVNSVVSQFLGLSKPSYTGRSAVRGFVHFEDGHGLEPKFMQLSVMGARIGVIPTDDYGVYWFLTFTPSSHAEKEMVEDPKKLKQFILSKLGRVSDEMRQVIEKTKLENLVCNPLRYRHPWEMLWGNISKDNVCVLGDALHPMTPNISQGGCCALEDSVVLTRLLGEALIKGNEDKNEQRRIQDALEKLATERRWRSFNLIAASYVLGFIQESDGVLLKFLRDKFLNKLMGIIVLKQSSFDCGTLTAS